jgi:four helix bundle protein
VAPRTPFAPITAKAFFIGVREVQSAEYRAQNPGQRPIFQNLVVWQKAHALATELVALVDQLPAKRSAGTLGNQLLRSGASVSANIAEGYGRFSEGAYRNHLSIARGSLFETESWIDLLASSGYITAEVRDRLIDSCEEVARILSATMKPLKTGRASSVREEGAEYVTDADV